MQNAKVVLLDQDGDGLGDTRRSRLGSSIVDNGDGSFTYTRPWSNKEDDKFRYRVVDSMGAVSSSAAVQILFK